MSLRICYVFSAESYHWQEDSKMPGGGGFEVGLSFLYNLHLENLSRLGMNFSVTSDSTFGSLTSDQRSYDGCFGRLQKNESDLILSDIQIPMIGENLIHGPVLFGDKMTILSTYNPEVRIGLPDLMECFNGFLPETWIAVIFVMMLLITGISISTAFLTCEKDQITWLSESKKRIIRMLIASMDDPATSKLRQAAGTWQRKAGMMKRGSKRNLLKRTTQLMTSALLKQHRETDDLTLTSLTICVLTILIIMNGFYVTFYFTSLISTTAVVTKKPSTIESYADILAANIRPVWAVVTNSHEEFRAAKDGKEKQVWDKAVSIGIEASLAKVMDFDALVIGNQVWLLYGIYAKGTLVYVCSYTKSKSYPYIPLARSDATTKEKLYTSMKSGHLNGHISSRVDSLYERIIEAGFMEIVASHNHRLFGTTIQDTMTCQSNRVLLPNQEVPPLELAQGLFLVVSCSVILVIAVVVIALEMYCYKKGH